MGHELSRREWETRPLANRKLESARGKMKVNFTSLLPLSASPPRPWDSQHNTTRHSATVHPTTICVIVVVVAFAAGRQVVCCKLRVAAPEPLRLLEWAQPKQRAHSEAEVTKLKRQTNEGAGGALACKCARADSLFESRPVCRPLLERRLRSMRTAPLLLPPPPPDDHDDCRR